MNDTEATTLAALRRRLPDPDRVELAVAAADRFDVVIHVDPSMQHIFVREERHPDGVLARRPVGDVIELLHRVGAGDTAARLAAPPPAGHTWAVWLGRGCALAAPWPAPSLDTLATATLTVARPDLAVLANQVRAKGVAFADVCFVVGAPLNVERITGRPRCGCVVAGAGVDRAELVAQCREVAGKHAHLAAPMEAIARDLAADVPPGQVRVLVATTDHVGTVATIPVPRRGEPLPRYRCEGSWS